LSPIPVTFTPSAHTHDDRYYTESEITTNYYSKTQSDARYSVTTHTHDDRYYTESEIDTKLGQINFAFVASNDSTTNVTGAELETLTNGSNADGLHTHDFSGSGGGGTLDEAYGQWGEGRIINVDSGAVQLSASNGFAPLKISPITYVPNQWLSGGEICYKDNELYYYDSTRAKWLSVSMTTVTAGTASSTAAGYMYTHNSIQMSSTIGFTFPFNGTVVGISMANANSSTSCDLIVKVDGSDLTSKWISGRDDSTDNLNADFDKDTTISFYIDASGSQRPNKPNVILFVRRRP